MYSHDQLVRLIGLAYDAAVSDEAWQAFLDAVAETMGAHTVTLWAEGFEGPGRYIGGSSRMDPAFKASYEGYFAARDPWLLAGRTAGLLRRGAVELGENLVSESQLRRTEFFNDLGRKFNVIGGLAAVMTGDRRLAGFGAHQRKFGQFGDAERRLMAALSPHVERALAIRYRLSESGSLQRATVDLLDRLPMAAFVVDAGAVPLLINQQGRSLIALESGIHSGRAGLVTDRASETRLLRELVALCAATTIGEGRHPGGTFRISRRPPRSSLHVMVAPVRFHEELAHGRRAVAILFIHDPSERAKLEPAALRRLYGLTGAETRLAVLIAQGRTVSEVCALLDVTPNTVRTHLKRIFQKTQTRSQSQLVYELLTGLASIAR